MRIKRKTVAQLLLTPEELSQLMEMIHEAEQGKTVHYSERLQPNGSYFGIGIDPAANDDPPRMRPANDQEAYPRPRVK